MAISMIRKDVFVLIFMTVVTLVSNSKVHKDRVPNARAHFVNSLKIWETKNCVFPPKIMYSFGASPLLSPCWTNFNKSEELDLEEQNIFVGQICTSLANLATNLCSSIDFRDYLKDNVIIAMVDSGENENTDVCKSIESLKSKIKTSNLLSYIQFVKQEDCRKFCVKKTGVRFVCLLLSGSVDILMTKTSADPPSPGNDAGSATTRPDVSANVGTLISTKDVSIRPTSGSNPGSSLHVNTNTAHGVTASGTASSNANTTLGVDTSTAAVSKANTTLGVTTSTTAVKAISEELVSTNPIGSASSSQGVNTNTAPDINAGSTQGVGTNTAPDISAGSTQGVSTSTAATGISASTEVDSMSPAAVSHAGSAAVSHAGSAAVSHAGSAAVSHAGSTTVNTVIETDGNDAINDGTNGVEGKGSGAGYISNEPESPGSGNFMAYFLTVVVLCIAGYVVFHNKQKIMGFIVEGRASRQRRRTSGGGKYKKLESGVEEVVPSLDKSSSVKNFIY